MRVKLNIPEPEDRHLYERHEVYFGSSNRQVSIKWGFVIYLPHFLHNTNYTTSIHRDEKFCKMVQADYEQMAYDKGWTKQEFYDTFKEHFI